MVLVWLLSKNTLKKSQVLSKPLYFIAGDFQLSCFVGCHKILVSLLAARAEVQFDPSLVTALEIAESISELGFPASIMVQSGAGQSEVMKKRAWCGQCQL